MDLSTDASNSLETEQEKQSDRYSGQTNFQESISTDTESVSTPAVGSWNSASVERETVASCNDFNDVTGLLKCEAPREFDLAGRNTYIRVDLDAITQNLSQLKKLCSTHTDIIAVIKANAYGHGSVGVARHLVGSGIRHFAVATAQEGVELRRAGIDTYIQVLGSCSEREILLLRKFRLTPTVATDSFIRAWAKDRNIHETSQVESRPIDLRAGAKSSTQSEERPPVVLKVDTGMSRNGCYPNQLSTLVDLCRHHKIPVHSIMTHFAQAWDDRKFTQQQFDIFMSVAEKYRGEGIKLHIANSAGIINGFGTDLDFVRPGIAMYGQTPDNTDAVIRRYQELGLRPALSWLARPSLMKTLDSGQFVGYDKAYRCTARETIAIFSVGYGDGYNRLLSSVGHVTSDSGTPCPIIGRVSMDAITVRLAGRFEGCRTFYIMKNDYTSLNSVTLLSQLLDTISYEVLTNLSPRVPRIYFADGQVAHVENGAIQS